MSRYRKVRLNGKIVPEHHKVWIMAHGPIPDGCVIHHKNGKGRDNRLRNLICLTRSEHAALHAKLRKAGKDVVDIDDPYVISDREHSTAWCKEHQSYVNAKHAKWVSDNLEHRRKYEADYYIKNKSRMNANMREYCKINRPVFIHER